MNDKNLQEIYRKRVLEHSRNPHHFGRPETFNRKAQGYNPLCGDKVTIFVHLDDDKIDTLSFEGSGCAISIASASMMTDALQGLSVKEAEAMSLQLHNMFQSENAKDSELISEIKALEGVRSYPSRIKCATLAWSTLDAALDAEHGDPVCTE